MARGRECKRVVKESWIGQGVAYELAGFLGFGAPANGLRQLVVPIGAGPFVSAASRSI